MLLLIDIFSINTGRGYENPSLEIIVTERCSNGVCPLEEACEHCYLNQSAISIAILYIISVYCEDFAGYLIVILSFLTFHLCYAYYYISGILQVVSEHFPWQKLWVFFFLQGRDVFRHL